jgi:hypothetical protein
MITVGPASAKKEERLTSLIPVLEPREECTLPTLIELLEDCEISDSDAIKDKGKPSLECMKGGRRSGLRDVGFIREEEHPDWLANIVPVTKKNGQTS